MSARFLRFQARVAEAPRRAPLLERLLARAEPLAGAADWRADAFRILAPQTPMPAGAAMAYRAAGGPMQSGSVFIATPVHYLAEISNVRLVSDGILTLEAAEATTLALDFNREWRDAGVNLWAASGRLFCGLEREMAADTSDPAAVLGRHLHGFLPSGIGGASLRALMSEMEIWLFDHPVNRIRRQGAQLPISALWLWGGGTPLASLPVVRGGAAGGDVIFDAFAARDERGADVMVLHAAPDTAEWSAMEQRWLMPTLADLQHGQIARLELSAGGRRFAVGAGWRRKFWRKTKPWWEYFD